MGRKRGTGEGGPDDGEDDGPDAPPMMMGMQNMNPMMMGGMNPMMMGGGMGGPMGGQMGGPMGGQMGGPMGGQMGGGMGGPMGGPMGGMNPMMMGGMNPMAMMGGMGGMNPMAMMGGMNPMAMMMGNMMAMNANMASGGAQASTPSAPPSPPPEPIDPRVKEICKHYNIDEKICEKLNKAMKTREDFDEDMQVLWHIMEKGARNNKKPVDVMLVKIREITNGTFIGKDLLDPDIKEFAWKYNLDDQLLHRLVKTMKMRGSKKKQDLRDMDERIGNARILHAKHPSGLLVRMLEGLEENGKIPPAPGWVTNSVGLGAARREPAERQERKRSRSRSRGR